jgi:hypothetical protein
MVDPAPTAAQDGFQEKHIRNQDKEKEVEEEVRRSCQNIQWTRGPLPKNMDHWFYDLRGAGTVPPESLVSASRTIVLRWKGALGEHYFPFENFAGGSVLNLENAHRTFKALTNKGSAHLWLGFQGLRKAPEGHS